MSSLLSSVASSLFNSSSAAAGTTASWMNSAETAIQASQDAGGLLGMLQNAADGTSVFAGAANTFASITTNNTTAASQFYAQIAAQRIQKEQAQKIQQAQDDAAKQAAMIKPESMLEPIIYLDNGTSLDTTSNILTMSDGTQYDALTGAKYVDPTQLTEMPDGSTLDTKNNILTMTNGTQIDTVTGLTITSGTSG
ncbi:MAG TPA: hypothetical protein VFB45_07225 [Pseudolabrys sp.]|nr:hypothetical protein [Pseudolabrys sp.]